MFEPLNRYLHVEIVQPEKETPSGILLPEDFKPAEARHVVASVCAWSPDVRFAEELLVGSNILVDKSMVEEVTINGTRAHLILDNYVLGLIR
jgi:co-chaperonin GroES (HSP10)